ncbi:hypothetical protein HGA88_04975 [Candidatus Roizmanbacteria bacterium]|nr:hypothetical protein [Candidatus Roizmanbacteria bacterium]
MKKTIIAVPIFLFALLILIGGVVFVIARYQHSTPQKVSNINPSVPLAKAQLKVANSDQKLTVGIPIRVEIVGSSLNHAVTGYDVIVSYDKKTLTLVSAQSLLPSFNLFKIEKETGVTLTGVLSLAEKKGEILSATPFIALNFVPKTYGAKTISVMPSLNKSKTQFIDQDNNSFLPLGNEITISVQ